ncbi:MAG: GNAT family N-acetyltransferase [Algisphaera sp.]
MTLSPSLQIIAPHLPEHHEAISDLSAKVFGFDGAGNYFGIRQFLSAGYFAGSHYDPATSRIGLIDGQVVSHFGVWAYDMRVGAATVRCGGVGAVLTHPHFRKRGHLVKTAHASIDAMREAGHDLSSLFGINDYYDRLGYVRAFPSQQHRIQATDLPAEKPASTIRKFKLVRREDTDALYNRTFADVTGTAVRPTFTRAGNIRGEGYRWVDGRDRLAGYVYIKHDSANRRLNCHEAVGDPTQVLRTLGQLARKLRCDDVTFIDQPIQTPLMQRVRQSRCEIITHINPNGGPMAQVLNLRTTLAKIANELHLRLRQSPMAKWTGTLHVDDGKEKAALHITARKITVSSESSKQKTKHKIKTRGHAVALVFGTNTPESKMREANMQTTGDAAALAAALFPEQNPMLLPFDHF